MWHSRLWLEKQKQIPSGNDKQEKQKQILRFAQDDNSMIVIVVDCSFT